MALDIHIRPETAGDYEAIAAVNRLAFEREDEADLVAALHRRLYDPLARRRNRGAVCRPHFVWTADHRFQSRAVPAVSLAPMAVVPVHQRQGIGSRLVEEGLRGCRKAGHKIVVVLGHPQYYSRFGFSAPLAAALESPFSGNPAWMALELQPRALHGVAGKVIHPPPFGINE